MFQLTHSATLVALVPIADTMALVLTGSVGGRWADRWPRGLVLTAMAGAIVLTGIALAMGTGLQWWALLLTTFGLFGGLRLASLGRTVLTNRIFRGQLVEMNSAVGFIHSAAKVVGPLLGGAGFVVLGIHGALLIALGTQCTVWGVAVLLPHSATVEPLPRRLASAPTLSGWSYLQSHPALRRGVQYFSLYMLSGSVYSSLFYIFLIRVVHAPTIWYPIAMAIEGLGNVLIAGWVPYINRRWSVSRIMTYATLGMVISDGVLFAWPHLWLIAIVNPLVGMATQVAMVTVRAHYQQQSKSALVGRMLGIRSAVANVFAMGGSLLAASLVTVFSSQDILLGSMGCLVMAAGVGAGLTTPRKAEQSEHPVDTATPNT